jgi:hypothetical protein
MLIPRFIVGVCLIYTWCSSIGSFHTHAGVAPWYACNQSIMPRARESSQPEYGLDQLKWGKESVL